jgi:hypothetical protein
MAGLALIAALAFAAVGASAAGATNFTASKYTTQFTGESAKGNDTFVTEGGRVECKAHYQGTMPSASESQTVEASYTECKAFGFLSATVTMNGCDYVFYTSGKVDLTCPGFESIVIKASTCTVTLKSQPGLEGVGISNVWNGITVWAGIKGIDYSVTQDGIGCPFNGIGTKFGGEYRQHWPITLGSISGTTIDVG